MYPYPSASFLHMGHVRNYTIGDVYARFKRMQGFNVLYPIGYDALGLPAENAAIKNKTHPREYTKNSIKNFMKQQKAMGWSYDWSRLVNTSEPEFYKWDQWIFLKMLEKGIAYRKKAPVNFCEKCNSVLANEQVVNGCCWRHEDTQVEIKHLEQWFFRITDYAEEFLDGLEKINWPENAKKLQRNWIGKSHGTEINFEINSKTWKIFTTRPDTIFGVTFMVVSSQHSKLMELVTKEQKKEVEKFLRKIKSVSEKEMEDLEKEGAFTGSYAINPMTNEKIPVYVGNFVVADYGSGMVMAVPAHDQRDFEFAKKYGIKIKQVIVPNEKDFEKSNIILKALDKIKKEADKKKIDFWILGGLACGFHSSIIYREFSDLDLIVKDKKEHNQFCKLLEEIGYKKVNEKKLIDNSIVATYRNDQGIEIDIGSNVIEIDLRESDFEKDEKELNGIKSKVISKRFCENFKKYFLTQRKKDKDIIDFNFLNGRAYTSEGVLINSLQFNGLSSEKAKEEITKYLEKKKLGKRTINYKLRDWLISRQRYWGTPIPIIYCDKCGIVRVPEKALPVILPEKVKFGKGNPLATNKEFVDVKCPKCRGKARRETDTMDTFVNSSWYFLRYTDSKNKNEIFDRKKANYWCPIDQYIGGPEHITMHLIYIRFYTKFLRDLGLLEFDEPALKYFTQGIVHGSDGEKMSKSRGNVVEPLNMIEKYGADTLRLALVSFASPDNDFRWDEKIVLGSHKFLNKVYEFFSDFKDGKVDLRVEARINKAVKEIAEDIENFRHNLAIIKIRQLFEYFSDKKIDRKNAEKFLLMLHVYCPFITEELWEKIGNTKNFISLSEWPKAEKINENLLKQDEMIEKLIGDINNIIRILESKGEKKNKVKIFAIPNEVEIYSRELGEIKKRINLDAGVFSIKNAKSDGKIINAKPGKPGILLE